jgi:hypothetical protein
MSNLTNESNLPIEFKTSEIVKNSSLHLSYSFDILNAIDTNKTDLPMSQLTNIEALQINLTGKTSNPNISISIDSKTRLFTLNSAYITDTYPHKVGYIKDKAFVIEGYSIENINKEQVLIYLPMTLKTDNKNLFYPLEDAILNNTPIKTLTFDDYIPNNKIDTDFYTYYAHTDSIGTLFHIIYFNSSNLGYTSALNAKIPTNKDGYISSKKVTNYISDSLAKRHDNMTNQFEDNIYIDCVPVDLVNKSEEKYLKMDDEYGKILQEVIMYLVYIIIMSAVVYGFYYLNVYFSPKNKPTP